MHSEPAVLTPIYMPALPPLHEFSLDQSLIQLKGRDIRFLAPNGLDVGYYTTRYPGVPFHFFDASYFASIAGYNRLLLDPRFYERFARHEFVLILQTDAIIFRDELDFWCSGPFDYIGAPWPGGWEVSIDAGRFSGPFRRRERILVGNGGLSLRRVGKCIALLEEFGGDVAATYGQTCTNEDMYFAWMGALSSDFIMPNEMTASRFSVELQPSYYVAMNGGRLPMGAHAWWKYEPEFWRQWLPGAPLELS